MTRDTETWPALPLEAWTDTCDTLHMWTQIVGKLRLALAPHVNHWWQVTLYVTPRGLTTSAIPAGDRSFDATFDFIDHVLRFQTSDGSVDTIALRPQTVADFYAEVMRTVHGLGVDARITTMPQEFEDPIRFDEDTRHASYDPGYAQRFWRTLVTADSLLKEFRARFIGKVSPVHFFWGSFDLAVTRFSGRRAPERPGADMVTREAYSHEVSSCGFWPGNGGLAAPAFYSYAAPAPEGFKDTKIRPAAAFYSEEFSNFLLPYDDARAAANPRATVLEFLQSTYEAAAEPGKWDRKNLERA